MEKNLNKAEPIKDRRILNQVYIDWGFTTWELRIKELHKYVKAMKILWERWGNLIDYKECLDDILLQVEDIMDILDIKEIQLV